MSLDRPAPRRQRLRPAAALLALSAITAMPAAAQEPLFLRIRAQPEPSSAAAALAAREAVWARSHARARAVIASVCTGCLGAWRESATPTPVSPAPPEPRLAAMSAATGLEADPVPGASEPPETPSRESRP